MLRVHAEAPRLRDVLGRFQRVDEFAEAELNAATERATESVYRQAQRNVRSKFGGTGRMENALQMTVRHGKRPFGEVFIRGAEYVVHELGGRGSYLIQARGGGVLAFETDTGFAFASRVRRGPAREQSYLRLALEQQRSEVREIFAEAARNISSRVAGG